MYGIPQHEEARRLLAAHARFMRVGQRAQRRPWTARKWHQDDRAVDAFRRQARRLPLDVVRRLIATRY